MSTAGTPLASPSLEGSPAPGTLDRLASAISIVSSPFLVGGRALVPVRPLLEAFALPHRWDPEGRTLHIDG